MRRKIDSGRDSDYNHGMKKLVAKMPRFLKGIIFHTLQWTWCLPQNLAGLFMLMILPGEHYRYHGALVTIYRKKKHLSNTAGFSLGSFIFMPETWSDYNKEHIVVHEYGHTVQSLLTGPFYIFIIGLPSVIWCRRFVKHSEKYRVRGIAYTDRFPEHSADNLGETYTGDKVA